jgi:transcriptional regulator with XRE-family HTH domain
MLNRLLKIRLKMGYKYAKDFAELLELNPNQYSRYESNKMQPSSEVVYKICKKLNIRIEEILYEEGE